MREREVTSQRRSDLRVRQDELDAELAALQDKYSAEQKDVERLEGISLSRVLASLGGSRDERLSRELAEADAARYRVAEAQARLEAIRREHETAQQRLDELAPAGDAYAAMLDEKERYLRTSGDRAAARC